MILKTKLYPPQVGVQLIPRPRLIERLNQGVANRLTLVSAPAGYGKSTLLSAWIGQSEVPVGWVSLDEGDQDFVRFLTYFIAALQEIDASLGVSTLTLLSEPKSRSTEEILIELVNDIADYPTTFALVLDDYHFIHNLAVHQAITFLLDNVPPQLHLIIATRNDPTLPLSRWRIRRQVSEVRETDLRFTLDETNLLLRQVLGYDLKSEQVARLNNRTEGWIAGLQMAGLSLAGLREGETATFIQDFTGDNRHLMDFLMDEVFALQSEAVQQFLLYTSVLDRFSAPLCQAIVGKDFASQALIENLERANLFLIPLDNNRQWYRYHRLFADFLGHRFQAQTPDQIVEIHRRACRWFAINGYWDEAVEQANAIGDIDFMTEIIAKQATTLFYESEFPTIDRWLNLLTDETILASPLLCTVKAWIFYFRRQASEAIPYLDQAELIIHQHGMVDSEMGQRIAQSVNTLRAWVARDNGDLATALQISQQALIGLPENNVDALALGEMFIADTLRHLGRLEEALPHYQGAYRHAQACGNYSVMTGATYYQAEILAQLDRFTEAKEQLQHTLAWFESQGMADQPSIALVEVGLGRRLVEERDFTAAEAHLTRGLQISVPERPKIFIPALLALAKASQAQSEMEQAQEYLQQAEALARKYNLEEQLRQVEQEIASLDLQSDMPPHPQKVTSTEPAQPSSLIEPLTERELKILNLLNTELTGPEIAQTLYVALSTVRFHTKNIYAKLGVSNRMAAVNQATEFGLL